MSAESRARITYGLGVLSGALLFFLAFAAVFVGSWVSLVVVMFGYAAAGAFGVWIGGVAPISLALALAIPAVPWVLWLFPAVALESGLLRALPWPGLAMLAGAFGWVGGRGAAAVRSSRARSTGAA